VSDLAVEVQDVGKLFRLYRERNRSFKATALRGVHAKYEVLWALRNVDLEVSAGTTYGLIGDNGSGKSTLLKCLARILVPDEGNIVVRGKTAALLELGSGFHPELTGRQNVFLNGAILGMSRRDLEQRFDAIVAFAGLEHAIDQPVKNYSSGMYVRLGFSVAINVEPEVLLVDEVLAVGDATFQRQCMERINLLRDSGATIVVVSHAAESIRSLCDTVTWLEKGQVMETGRAGDVVDRYLRSGVEERPSVAGDETRWGSGEIVIESVELLGPDGSPTTKVSTGDPVTVRIHFDAQSAVPPGAIGLGIWALDGTHLWGANTSNQDVDLGVLQGRGSIDWTVGRLALAPGVFDFDAAITDRTTTHIFDYRRRVLRFDVQPGDARETGGYLSLNGQWQPPRSEPH
jgi:ABC-2 type transport system ATP-binding protein